MRCPVGQRVALILTVVLCGCGEDPVIVDAPQVRTRALTGCVPGQVLLCHRPPGNTGKSHEQCVSVAAQGKHLEHGDRLGPCESPAVPAIRGRITDPSGAPIPGAGVCADPVGVLTGTWLDLGCAELAVAAPDGTYELFVADPSRDYLLQFVAAGYLLEIYNDVPVRAAGYDAAAVTPVAGNAVPIDAVLAPAAITGTITDLGGLPLSGVGVCADPAQGLTGTLAGDFGCLHGGVTGADGTYEVPVDFLARDYVVQFVGPGRLFEIYDDVPLTPSGYVVGDITVVAVDLSATANGIDAALASSSISGTVTDLDGLPLAGINVCADPAVGLTGSALDFGCAYQTVTDAGGRYTLAVSELTREYVVQFSGADTLFELYPGVPVTPAGYTVGAVTPVAVDLGGTATGIDAALAPASISGTVTGLDGTPLPGVNVCADPAEALTGTLVDLGCVHQTTTDAAGAYTVAVSDLSRAYLLHFTVAGYVAELSGNVARLESTYDLAAVSTVPVTTGAAATGVDAALAPATISGRVLDPAGMPLAGYIVCANRVLAPLTGTLGDLSCGHAAVTGADGRYTITASSYAAQYLVHFAAPGVSPTPLQIYDGVPFDPAVGYDVSGVTLPSVSVVGPATGVDAVLSP